MATMKPIRTTTALLKPLTTVSSLRLAGPRPLQHEQQRRTFFPNPFAAPTTQTLTASRILPYPPSALYSIISDVPAYHTFLPFCRSSKITSYSSPDALTGATHPETGTLTVGFNDDISETFHSRIYCVPNSIVEAVSGNTDTDLPAESIAHHSPRPTNHADDPSRNASVLTHLLTRWSLKPFPFKPAPVGATAGTPQEDASKEPARVQTEVFLRIEYAFANPVYAALSAAAAPKVADKMIQAFEERVRKTMDAPSHR